MATRQITCPTCSHAFAVSADARTAICPRCGKALPILASGISLDFKMPIPKKKSEKPKAAPPPPPPTPQEAKLARISLRKASEKRPTRGFEDLSAVTRPAGPAPADLPPAPEATIPGERGYQVEILPRHARRRDDSDGATGIDLPLRPPAARVEPGQYPESGVGMDEPTAVPHEGELIQVESGTWPSQGQEQVVDDEAWDDPPIDEMATAPEAIAPPLPPLPPRVLAPPPPRGRPPVPPARRAPGPPPRTAPPPAPSPRVLVTAPPVEDDPRVTAMRLKAISDDELPPGALEQLGPDELGPAYDEAQPDLGPAYDEAAPDDIDPAYDEAAPDLGLPDLGLPDLGPSPNLDGFGSPDPAAPLDGLGQEGLDDPASAASTISGSTPVPQAPLAPGRTASFHRDLSPSARVAALTDAIDDEVSREIPIPPASTQSALYPPQQAPATMTSLGIGPNPAAGSGELEDDAPLVLPDTGIMVFVPDQPIEERSLGEEKPAPAAPRYKSGNTMELSPLQQRRRSHVAGGHGVATRRPSSELEVVAPKKKRLWIALVAGSLVLVALVVGLVLALR
jgi:hypothetical protein